MKINARPVSRLPGFNRYELYSTKLEIIKNVNHNYTVTKQETAKRFVFGVSYFLRTRARARARAVFFSIVCVATWKIMHPCWAQHGGTGGTNRTGQQQRWHRAACTVPVDERLQRSIGKRCTRAQPQMGKRTNIGRYRPSDWRFKTWVWQTFGEKSGKRSRSPRSV